MKILDIQGNTVAADDPKRMLWYSASCGYWTDDWSTLCKLGPGIPCCPICGCPGMQAAAGEWFDGATEYEKGHPGYLAFLNENKETCLKRKGGMLKAWEKAKRKD